MREKKLTLFMAAATLVLTVLLSIVFGGRESEALASDSTNIYWGFDYSTRTLHIGAESYAYEGWTYYGSFRSDEVFTNIKNGKDYYSPWLYAGLGNQIVKAQIDDRIRPVSMKYWFYNLYNLETVNYLWYIDSSQLTDMSYMFYGCSSIEYIDFSMLRTDNVTNMNGMFYGCSSLRNLVLTLWNTGKVRDFENLFAYCTNLKNIYAYDFDFSSTVSKPQNMFTGCYSLVGGNGTYYEFYKDCMTYSKVDKPDSPGYFICPFIYWGFDASTGTFHLASDNRFESSVYSKKGSFWATEEFEFMLFGPDGYEEEYYSPWYNSGLFHKIQKVKIDTVLKPIYTSTWFYGCYELKEIEGLELLDTSEVKSMFGMFEYCSKLTSLDLSFFDYGNNDADACMFYTCSLLKTIYSKSIYCTDNSSWSMFYQCDNLVGGYGTRFRSGYDDGTYARVDSSWQNGYFTEPNTVQKPEIKGNPVNATVNSGDSAYFSVKAEGKYLSYIWQYWDNDNAMWMDWPTKTTPSISIAYSQNRDGMRVRCKVRDFQGYVVVSNEAKLIYSYPLKISVQPVSTSVNVDETAKFGITATGNKLTYLWQYKKAGATTWTDWSTKTTANITVAYDKSRQGMSLRCRVTDGVGKSVLSNTVTLTYKSTELAVTKQPVSVSVDEGTVASFSLTATGTKITYLWQYKKTGASSWTNWTTKTTAAITVAYDKSRDGMSLRCKLTDGNGKTVYSNTVTLNYKSSGPTITKQPVNASVLDGEYAAFSVRATGTKLKYLWQYKKAGASSWTNWTTKTTAAITVAYDKSRDGMSLRCKVTDGNGKTVYSNKVTLTYEPAGPKFTKQPANASVASGELASFAVTATGTKLTYLWQYKKTGASSWTNWTTKTAPAITVAYDKSRDGMSLRCKVTDANGNTAYSNTVTLTYKSGGPVITKQPANASALDGEYAAFSVKATGTKLTYLWQYKNAGSSTWVDWTSKTTAMITVAYSASRNGMQVRCKVTDGNGKAVTSNSAVLTYIK